MPERPGATFRSIAPSLSINRAVEAVAGFAGLAVYVVFIGGVKQWGRFTAAGLPADQAIDALEPNKFFGDGAGVLVFPIGAVLVILYVGRLVELYTSSERPAERPRRRPSAPSVVRVITQVLVRLGALFVAVTLTLALVVLLGLDEELLAGKVLVLVGFGVIASMGTWAVIRVGRWFSGWLDDRARTEFDRWLTVGVLATFAAAVFPLALGLYFIGLFALIGLTPEPAEEDERLPTRAFLLRVGLLGALIGLVGIAAAAQSPVRFDRIVLPDPTKRGAEIELAVLGKNGDDLLAGSCNKKTKTDDNGNLADDLSSVDVAMWTLSSKAHRPLRTTRGGYAFYSPKERTVLSVALGSLGVRVPKTDSLPVWFERVPDHVCGDRPLPAGSIGGRLRLLEAAAEK